MSKYKEALEWVNKDHVAFFKGEESAQLSYFPTEYQETIKEVLEEKINTQERWKPIDGFWKTYKPSKCRCVRCRWDEETEEQEK